ncbi:MAG: flp pilus-assembly TadE/G-like family protein [Actinomycetaceae bacterium]|nr:flp pilus-assembly TadE/G-like family protein [Actinomycetaceae bacterium]
MGSVQKPGRLDGETGNATVRALAVIVVAVIFGLSFIAIAQVHRQVQSAQTGLDMAALAGAQTLIDSYGSSAPDSPCQVAADVAARNGLSLSTCTVAGLDILTTSNIATRAGPFAVNFTVKSRAGADENSSFAIVAH